MPSRLSQSPAWICSQIGAREHYAVPRVLHRDGRLAAFYTDYWAGTATRFVASKANIRSLSSLAARFNPALASAPVHSWNWRSLGWQVKSRYQARQAHNPYSDFLDIGKRFSLCVRQAMERRHKAAENYIFFTYDTGALEAMEWGRRQGIKCVLNQMDPGRVEVELVREEEKQWPGWQAQGLEVPEEYFQRREQEWALADCVVVNSVFCRDALVRQGVPLEKLFVMPLCYEVKEAQSPKPKLPSHKFSPERPLRVLFLGQVILRKGIQYLMAAARKLESENVRFDVVGPTEISSSAMSSAPSNLVFHGRATRDQAATWYRRADLFVLPTLSDGFALTQLEAMAHGLPVITTPCCGEVVSQGLDGFLVPPRDPDELAKTFLRYLADPDLLIEQQQAALVKAKQFASERLMENLRDLEVLLLSK